MDLSPDGPAGEPEVLSGEEAVTEAETQQELVENFGHQLIRLTAPRWRAGCWMA